MSRVFSAMNETDITAPYKHIANQIQENIVNLYNFQFLIEATSILSASLDYEATLTEVANIAVPRFADWCSIHIKQKNGEIIPVVVAHVDPDKVKFAKLLREKFPDDPAASRGVPEVIRTGKSEMMSEIPEELVTAAARSKEHLAIIKQLGLRSYMCVPVIARGKVLGAITCVAAESGRRYNENDLAVVEDLGRIVGIALDNALLYKEIADLNVTLEQKVLERTKELERSNRELQDFAYVASHDLQEPLRKVQAFGDLLREEYREKLGEGDEYLKRMLDAAGRMRVLINDLLAFSRVTTKALPFTTVNLSSIAKEVLSDLETDIIGSKAKITVGDMPRIEADPLQMRRLFQNMLSNAIKFRKKDTQLVVTLSAHKKNSRMHEIVVEDNGIGFDEKYAEKIFTIFERLHGRQEYEGTGIGLAVVRKIVERHGGEVHVKSKPGTGSKFIVTLPVRQEVM